MDNKRKRALGNTWYLFLVQLGAKGLFFAFGFPIFLGFIVALSHGHYAEVKEWFPAEWSPKLQELCSAHYKVLTFVIAFAASIIFLFRDKRWTDRKHSTLKEIIEDRCSYDKLKAKWPREEGCATEEQMRTAHSDYMGVVDSELRALHGRMKRLYTVFSANIFYIGIFSALSVLFVYCAQFTENPERYKQAFAMFVFVIPLLVYHIWIVILPIMVVKTVTNNLRKIDKHFIDVVPSEVKDISKASRKLEEALSRFDEVE